MWLHLLPWVGTAALAMAVDAGRSLPPLVYAVNCGGPEVTDSLGIRYNADHSEVGIHSDYGVRLPFHELDPKDKPLYNTERYGQNMPFGYKFFLHHPQGENADYTIVARFAEVYFDHVGGKVFDLVLNGHTIHAGLDIFKMAGGVGRAYDFYYTFSVKDGLLVYDDGIVEEFHDEMELTFAVGASDNPKCNAFAVFKADQADIPRPQRYAPPKVEPEPENDFPSIPEEDHNAQWAWNAAERQEKERAAEESARKFGSGPPVANPYEDEDPLSGIWPIVAVMGCAVVGAIVVYRMR